MACDQRTHHTCGDREGRRAGAAATAARRARQAASFQARKGRPPRALSDLNRRVAARSLGAMTTHAPAQTTELWGAGTAGTGPHLHPAPGATSLLGRQAAGANAARFSVCCPACSRDTTTATPAGRER